MVRTLERLLFLSSTNKGDDGLKTEHKEKGGEKRGQSPLTITAIKTLLPHFLFLDTVPVP